MPNKSRRRPLGRDRKPNPQLGRQRKRIRNRVEFKNLLNQARGQRIPRRSQVDDDPFLVEVQELHEETAQTKGVLKT